MTLLASVVRAKQTAALTNANATLLENLLEAASEVVHQYCNTLFEAASTTTEKRYGTGLPYFFALNRPITALTSVTITEQDGSSEVVAAASLEYDANTGKISFGPNSSSGYSVWPKCDFPNLTVAYAYGYATVPEPVQEACVQIAQAMYAETGAANPSIQSYTLGEYSETRARGGAAAGAGALTPLAVALLERYRNVNLF